MHKRDKIVAAEERDPWVMNSTKGTQLGIQRDIVQEFRSHPR